MRSLPLQVAALALFASLGCKTAEPASETQGIFTSVHNNLCKLSEAILSPVANSSLLSAGTFLIKLGVPQGTDAKNVCSCIFVSGISASRCIADETVINLKSGQPKPFLLDTTKIIDVKVTTQADPDHPGQTIGIVTATTKFDCADLGGPQRIARYYSYRESADPAGPHYGCVLDGTPVDEAQMP